MARTSVIKLTILAQIPYDKDVFGNVGKAEETARAFQADVEAAAKKHGVELVQFKAAYGSVGEK